MSPRFFKIVIPSRLYCVLAFLIMGSLGIAAPAVAQEEPDSTQTPSNDKPQSGDKLPVDERIYRLLLRYENEVSFFLPEGEFGATLEKKFGHFVTQARARYNFLRGDMGFSLQNLYTRFRLVPLLHVYDRLNFVPLFSSDRVSRDRVWRREQGIQFGVRMFLIQPINALTSLNYQRFSFPSTIINNRGLESQKVYSMSQAFGVQADSADFLGFFNSGLWEVEIVRGFPFGSNRADFWQLQISTQGESENQWITIEGEARLVSLLAGQGAPPLFLGGRDRLSAYIVNEFSGINLFYVAEANRLHLNKKKPLGLMRGFSLYEMNLLTHAEIGQVGDDAKMRDLSGYHASVGLGFSGVTAYRQRRAFEIFFYVYKALEHDGRLRYYVGMKY
jgi:hypothetical protein